MKRLQGKVITVTGASSGLGAATARQLAAEGAKSCWPRDVCSFS